MFLALILITETSFRDNQCSCHEIPLQNLMCVTRKCYTFGSGCRCFVDAAVLSRNYVFFSLCKLLVCTVDVLSSSRIFNSQTVWFAHCQSHSGTVTTNRVMKLSKLSVWHIVIVCMVFFIIQIIVIKHNQDHVWLIHVCLSELCILNCS